MPTPDIIERVKSLRDELGETKPAPALAPGVEELKAHADRLLAEPDHAAHYRSLSERLLAYSANFQTDHPKLASSMESLVDSLAKVGL